MANIQIDETPTSLQINYSWKSPSAYILLFFCAFWDGFLFIWYSIALSGEGSPFNIMTLFPLIHVAVGIGLTYYTAARFINSTKITVSSREISISHGPMPWPGGKTYPSKELQQLYVERTESQDRSGSISYNYNLKAIMRDGSRPVIISQYTLSELSSHKQLEQQIERYLNITDYRVDGEFGNEAKPALQNIPRGVANRDSSYIDYRIKDLRMGFVFQYDLKNWEVVYEEQYDWENRTDRFLQITSDAGTSELLYLQQDLSLTLPWLEQRLDQHVMGGGRFQAHKEGDRVVRIVFDGEEYSLKETMSGTAFFKSTSQQASTATQRLYLTANHRKSLRMLNTGLQLSVYAGEQLASHEFSNILPSVHR